MSAHASQAFSTVSVPIV